MGNEVDLPQPLWGTLGYEGGVPADMAHGGQREGDTQCHELSDVSQIGTYSVPG